MRLLPLALLSPPAARHYHNSATRLPPLPNGRELELATLDGVLGGTVWPAARALCEYLLKNRDVLAGTSCVELGAGTGAVGLYAAALGAAKVTLTDHRPPLAATTDLIHASDGDLDLPSGSSDRLLELLRANVARNAAPDRASVMELDWASAAHAEAVRVEAQPTLLLGADLTYTTPMHAALAETIARLLGDGGVCYLAHQERVVTVRGVDAQLEGFEAAASDAGLSIAERSVARSARRTLILRVVASDT